MYILYTQIIYFELLFDLCVYVNYFILVLVYSFSLLRAVLCFKAFRLGTPGINTDRLSKKQLFSNVCQLKYLYHFKVSVK